MTISGLPARRAALHLCDQILSNQKLMSELLANGATDKLPPNDRARAKRLANETLRHLGRIDEVISQFVKKPPSGSVLTILQIATLELCTGGAPHGVVNDWVEICAKGSRTRGLKGLVNAVLRKVADQGPVLWGKAGVARMPEWLRGPLTEAWGEQAMTAMERAHEAGAPLDITARGEATDLAARLSADLLPTGSLRLREAGQVSMIDGFEAGDWWVQDAAAAMPARILAPAPGERILDLCAAPGGKTMQLAAAGAKVTAVDLSANRLERLRENLSRVNLPADILCADVLDLEPQMCDAILLDAPCSATGTLRRHPDLPFGKDGSEFGELIELQAKLLDHAIAILPSGGRLVFCTCSLLPDEGEVQIEEALERHPDVTTDRDALKLPGIDPAWITHEGGLRLRPDFWADRGGMDGFYIALLRKT